MKSCGPVLCNWHSGSAHTPCSTVVVLVLLGTWSPQRLPCSIFFCTQIMSSNGGHSKMIQNCNFHGEIIMIIESLMIKKGILFMQYLSVPYVQRRCRILRSKIPTFEIVHGPQGNTRYGMNQVLFDGWSFAFPRKSECINFRYGRMGWSDWTWCNIPNHQHPLPVAFKAKSRVTLESCGRSAFGELHGWRMQRLHILYSGSFNDKCRCRWQAYANAWCMSWYGLFGPQSHSINLVSVLNKFITQF